MKQLKFLTICEGGAVRSVCLAAILRWDFGQDAIPVSGKLVPDETLAMLCEWADFIIVMVPEYGERIPVRFTNKMRVVDVGPDIWRNSMHKQLMSILGDTVQQWKGIKWDI